MEAERRAAHQKLSVLQLAETLGNVSEACRQPSTQECSKVLDGYLHAVVDTFGSYAFGFLHTTKQSEAAAAILHNDVLPFYREKGARVDALLTDNGREYCGKDTHPYELYLELNDIEHR